MFLDSMEFYALSKALSRPDFVFETLPLFAKYAIASCQVRSYSLAICSHDKSGSQS